MEITLRIVAAVAAQHTGAPLWLAERITIWLAPNTRFTDLQLCRAVIKEIERVA